MIEIFPRTKKDYEDLKGFETEILDLDFLRESPDRTSDYGIFVYRGGIICANSGSQ